ncbi:thioredoxin domain-containing protein [Rhizorhabdus wittichii]|uniref:Thioredoxin domain-containing protein n=1 Tax=Rhizorhabdus wittichii TaxID=160791 RepID=A0A975HFK3_9SPHN|nr:thioredoxin domain-containing protein [Rhizorhabdus wittichii]QTH23488.1 thioredoxin domain-containing protein [Rhizorhabdus wittichii]
MISILVRAALSLALLSSAALVAATPAKPAVAAKSGVAAKKNWLPTTSRTAEGAIVVGNPAAKVKLVEYLSLTCPHCADLSTQSMPALQRDYIAKGLVSFEVRHAVRDGYDFAASLLLRCEPPTRYLESLEALFATQGDWMEKALTAKDIPGFDGKSGDEKMAAVAKAAGFDAFFAKRGVTPKAYAACMADTKAKEQLGQMAGYAWQRDQIPGTPLVLINGQRQEAVHSWADLEPLIKGALK